MQILYAYADVCRARYRRHLLRLWLRDPEYAWETPEPLHGRWDKVFKDVKEEEQVFSLEPRVRSIARS